MSEQTQPRTPLRSQIVTTIKLVAVAGSLGLALWFLDQMLT